MIKNNNISEKIEEMPENPIPPYVNWELTNRCNMGCPYCFLGENPDGVIPDMPTREVKYLIRKLADNGARMLNYAGGEPLLRDDLPELIEYGKGLGLQTVLSTNGILLSGDMIKELGHYLDWVSLPVDGYDQATHDSVRGREGHFNEILSRLESIGETDINLKINTMLCRKNFAYAGEIANLLDGFGVRKWKLFQFSARGKARKIRDEYEISDEEFLSSRDSLGHHSFEAIYSSNLLRDNAYFLIGADGKVNAPVGDEYVYLGDLVNDDPETFRRPDIISVSKNVRNAGVSYDMR
jgi:MoaA/NifB/PqqE/SkfB family radical SAM enzyme